MKPTYTPNPADVATANSAVMAAYEKLDDIEQRNISNLARLLVAKVKDKNPRFMMSMEGAIEVIGKCGMELTKEQK
jgi:hypothetical protein